MKDNIMIGDRIRGIRIDMHMTREDFSELIDISPSFLSQIERGDKSMSIDTLIEISLKTGYSCDYILFGNDARSNYANKISRMVSGCSDDVSKAVYEVMHPLVRNLSK